MLNMSAMREVMPEKAALMDDIFGYRLSGQNVPTYNMSRHELSDTFTHCNGADNYNPDYQQERKSIAYSCKEKVFINMKPIYNVYWRDNSPYGYPGLYMAVSDIPIEMLKAIKHEIGNIPYNKWLENKREKEQKEAQEKERQELTEKLEYKLKDCSNEKLKKILDILEEKIIN